MNNRQLDEFIINIYIIFLFMSEFIYLFTISLNVPRVETKKV